MFSCSRSDKSGLLFSQAWSSVQFSLKILKKCQRNVKMAILTDGDSVLACAKRLNFFMATDHKSLWFKLKSLVLICSAP